MNILTHCLLAFLENNIVILLCRDRSQERKKKENFSRNETIIYARRSNHILTYTYRFLFTDLE
jgi:hypothetical protein